MIDFDHAFLADENALCLPYYLLEGFSHRRAKTMKDVALELALMYLERLDAKADFSGFRYGGVFGRKLETIL